MRDFAAVAAEIIRNDPELAACAPAVEKELLHHELLGAMSEAGFLHAWSSREAPACACATEGCA